ncbi:D-alanyl-D-alanine carboxypeptidase [Paenibacillus sambharensis]|uniref:D-alanyl-D-alanine carboxypeptidase n=1 Tax=Paenibacillus sambharensis TaxID=1803190 RepID=A0A2W1LDR7_9BACL|nr:D-alanyl-D-alanine carboxypeptidase family protein [Paenibacillus sambharensis]PZD96220.1 D-alanyl-D-alanine carboxypeptidase [Paenibacillus sambharensis]
MFKQVAMLLCVAAAAVVGFKWISAEPALSAELKPELTAASAILMDADYGTVYYEMNADDALPPASMSKMMTEIVLLDRIKDGSIAWDDKVTISAYAANVVGAGTGAAEGQQLTVRELFAAMTVHSANDAAVALAEHAAGTETRFVEWMNAKAQVIGLSQRAFFANATGLSSADLVAFAQAASHGETSLTARDTAKLAAYLVNVYPDVLDVSKRSEVTVDQSRIVLSTTNMMLPGENHAYPGSDGLKTGYTQRAGYCFTGTAERNGKRLIAVVMGTPTSDARFTETKKLFHYGFGRDTADSWKAMLRAVLT